MLLRELTPQVYKEVFTTLTEEELKVYFGCQSDEELEEERKKYWQGLSMYRKSLFIFQMIEKQSNSVIGWCGYHTWYLPHHRAEIGYLLNSEIHWGKGLMGEALPYVLDYGFSELDLHRVEAFVGRENKASLRLLERSGFVYEGCLKEHYFTKGIFDDSLIYGLLRHQYKKA